MRENDVTTETTYEVTWLETGSTELAGHDWVVYGAPSEVTLEEARQLCAENKVRAKLLRPNGELVWWVFADGNFQSA